MQQQREAKPRTWHTSNGAELTVIGVSRAEFKRTNLAQIVSELPKRPDPASAVRDFERGRNVSFEQFARVEAAVLRVSPLRSVLGYVAREFQSVRELVFPTGAVWSTDHVLDVEHDLQCESDKQQRRLTLYVAQRDVVGIDKVIATTAAHQVALEQVMQRAVRHRNELRSGLRHGLVRA